MDHICTVKCKTYDLDLVRAAVNTCLDCFGGAKAILATGKQGSASKTVLLKANLVKSARAEEAVTTHPAVIQAVAEQFIAVGARVLIGDCPAMPQSKSAMDATYRQTGLADVAAATGAELLYNASSRTVTAELNGKKRDFPFWETIFNVDLIVNCAKLKTHTFATMSGAAKNLFGLLPGLTKSAKHAENISLADFAGMLVALNEAAKKIVPVFSLIDGVVGMEGKGPTGGDPKFAGALIASSSAYAADYAGCIVMGLKPGDVPLMARAMELGLAGKKPEDYQWHGDDVTSMVTPFKLPRQENTFKIMLNGIIPRRLRAKFHRNTSPYPVINRNKCVSCGKCVEICPVYAATKTNTIEIDISKCIRCYCCHEICPKRAIDL